MGLAIAPRRLWRAFVRGRGSTTLYRHHWRAGYLDWRLGELRAFLGLDAPGRAAGVGDALRFVACALPGATVVGLLGVAARALGGRP
jgi:hypothetical protein